MILGLMLGSMLGSVVESRLAREFGGRLELGHELGHELELEVEGETSFGEKQRWRKDLEKGRDGGRGQVGVVLNRSSLFLGRGKIQYRRRSRKRRWRRRRGRRNKTIIIMILVMELFLMMTIPTSLIEERGIASGTMDREDTNERMVSEDAMRVKVE